MPWITNLVSFSSEQLLRRHRIQYTPNTDQLPSIKFPSAMAFSFKKPLQWSDNINASIALWWTCLTRARTDPDDGSTVAAIKSPVLMLSWKLELIPSIGVPIVAFDLPLPSRWSVNERFIMFVLPTIVEFIGIFASRFVLNLSSRRGATPKSIEGRSAGNNLVILLRCWNRSAFLFDWPLE